MVLSFFPAIMINWIVYRYRMRLINMACEPNYTFSIDGHTMTIIEVDGIAHKPTTVDSIQVLAGEDISVLILS